MNFNKAREEYKWKQWKEQEEKLLRQCGMNEESIRVLRQNDWMAFNEERRYQEHQILSPEILEQQTIEPTLYPFTRYIPLTIVMSVSHVSRCATSRKNTNDEIPHRRIGTN